MYWQNDTGTIWQPLDHNTNVGHFRCLDPLRNRGIFFASVGWDESRNLPAGFKNYLIFTEGPNIPWLMTQRSAVSGSIFLLGTYNHYNFFVDKNIFHVPFIEIHRQAQRMYNAFGAPVHKDLRYKFSSLIGRVTVNKIVSFMASLKYACCYSLPGTVEEKNVHAWHATGNKKIDDYMREFRLNWAKKYQQIDSIPFANSIDALRTHDYTHQAYSQSVININNESYPYSFRADELGDYIIPGPFITEKTLKCLLSATPFINNGQFNFYKTLAELGFRFDYGFDLSYDNYAGDIERMERMINVIEECGQYSCEHLYNITKDTCLFNQNHVMSQSFFDLCEQINQRSIDDILNNLA